MIKRIVMIVSWCGLLHLSTTLQANGLYPFDTAKQTTQFDRLLRELRCLVCQNQDLADSNAGLAKDLRNEVYALVKKGRSDDQIFNYLTKRYGDFILFKPKVTTTTLLLWFGPLCFLVLGLLIFWRACFCKSNHEQIT